MEEIAKAVFIFDSVHAALKAEKYLKPMSWPFLLVPVPPSVNEGCGVGIEVEAKDRQAAADYLDKNGVAPIQVVILESNQT
jgi:hypothetical protein